MTRIAILTPTLSSADAVSNDVLAMERLLSQRGHSINIFAENSNLAGRNIQPPRAALSYMRDNDDVLIYHHSIGWDGGIDALKTTSCRKIIKYHNVTPPEFFKGVSESHRSLCEKGRSQLRDIVACCPDLYMAASGFNRGDLIAAGSEDHKTAVVPPFNQADQLQADEADLELLDRYNDGSVNLLAVGGVRPNKGHAALIEAFATYLYHFNLQARLFIVGAENNAFTSYAANLRQLVQSWSIDSRIVFTGEVSEGELKTYYLLASALLITSEHEGFCVPLVEAMAMKVPIVAYASTAIPETAKDTALIWEERDPHLMAQSIDFLITNEATRLTLLMRGSQRYEQSFSRRAIEKQFLDVTRQAGFTF
ncbi:MAG TPA: glycosyltransferase family 4 protein [Pyrinomonadaceae bacterium]|jgi:glycosyltransferase involved in cell wall biosynthesis|nr:glycosyltransferase family 4 protein [Pyrinomonadaceae bacterium]